MPGNRREDIDQARFAVDIALLQTRTASDDEDAVHIRVGVSLGMVKPCTAVVGDDQDQPLF